MHATQYIEFNILGVQWDRISELSQSYRGGLKERDTSVESTLDYFTMVRPMTLPS